MNLQNETIENREIRINDANTFNVLGDNLVLKNCNIIISVPAKAIGSRAKIVGGKIIVDKELKGFDWCKTILENVKLEGKYIENNFASCTGVDFTGATLIDCQYFDDSVASCHFPRWPQFTFIDFDKILESAKNTNLGEMDFFLEDIQAMREYQIKAISMESEQISNAEGISKSDLKDWLNLLEGVIV